MRVHQMKRGSTVLLSNPDETVEFIRMEGVFARCKTKRKTLIHLHAMREVSQVGEAEYVLCEEKS